MRKRASYQRIMAKITVCGMLVLFFMMNMSTTIKATGYDSDTALEYAQEHCKDKVYCDVFAKRVLKAGGITIEKGTTRGVRNELLEKGYVEEIELPTETTTSGKIVMYDDSIIDNGDVMISYCNYCDVYPHIVIVSGQDSKGYVTVYATNKSKDNKRFYADHSCGHIDDISVYLLHILGTEEEVAEEVVTIQSSSYPAYVCIREGTNFNIAGNISSNCKINFVVCNIVDLDTNQRVISEVDGADSYTYSVEENIGKRIAIQDLPAGDYYIKLYVITSQSSPVLWDATFTVTAR